MDANGLAFAVHGVFGIGGESAAGDTAEGRMTSWESSRLAERKSRLGMAVGKMNSGFAAELGGAVVGTHVRFAVAVTWNA